MRRISKIAIVLLVFTVFLAACQATPDDPVVIQKDLEQMIEKGMEQNKHGQS